MNLEERKAMLKKTFITLTISLAAILATGGSRSVKAVALDVSDLDDPQERQVVEAPAEAIYFEQRAEVREEFHQTYPLTPDGRVSLENLNGPVRITVSDRNEVQVNAIKRAYKQERLNEAKIEVNATGDTVRIKTAYPFDEVNFESDDHRYENPATVEYTLVVPRRARLDSIDVVNGSVDIDGTEGDVKASSVNGEIRAHGLMGDTKLNTVNGQLEVTFAQIAQAKSLSLGSVNGGVTVVIPSDSNAVVRAETISGGIRNDFGLAVEDGDYVGHSLYGQIGSGGPRIKLSNVSGGISIKRAQDGRQLSPSKDLLSQKDKDKEKEKEKSKVYTDEELAKMNADARELGEQIRREVEPEVRREVQRALRESQREIQRAQREVSRERVRTRAQVRVETGRSHAERINEDRFTDQESKSFPVAGTPNLNVVTYDGTINVQGWDKQEVMYKATKRGGDEQQVKGIQIKTTQDGSSVSIVATSAEGDGSVDLEVFVPRTANVHMSSQDGHLSLHGVSGELTLRTSDGSIEVADSRGQLQANTGDGQIQVANFDGQADARTGDGPITLDGNFTALNARTGDGPISLSVPASSNFTIETNTEELNNEGLPVSEDVAPSKRAKRWKVGNGGNVFVFGTGEGTITVRPR
jgi:DUF4097 and DUF4098 domain-containing protein YvlB